MVLGGYTLFSTIIGICLVCQNHLYIEWRLRMEPPLGSSVTMLEPADAEKFGFQLGHLDQSEN